MEGHMATIAMAAEQAVDIEVGAPEDIEEGEFESSDYEWDAESINSVGTFQSMTNSVLQHEYENGRRYHHFRYGRYPIPNDDAEQGREALKHVMTLELANGKLIFAPIGNSPSRILDLGTGTGQWAMEVGDAYPMAEVIGTDLSPIQPSWIPPNVKFIVDDIEDEWVVGEHFDLIHIRHLLPVIRNVKRLIETAYDNLRPGGWLDIQELGGEICCDDGSVPENSALRQFFDLTAESIKAYGMTFRIANHLAEPLNSLGFSNVNCQVVKTPIGPWPKDRTIRLAGKYMQIVLADLIDAMGAKPLHMLDMDEEQRQDLVTRAKEELYNRDLHAYINYYFITAQRA